MSEDTRCQHYFIRDASNAPYACVAILPIDFINGIVCRGISICADGDQWNKKAARGRAISRAMKAEESGCNTLQCRNAKHPMVASFLHQYGNDYSIPVTPADNGTTSDVMGVFKSAASVQATAREKRILGFMAQKIDSAAGAE